MSDISDNKARMLRGDMYVAFTDELIAERDRCQKAMHKYNDTRDTSRRHRVQLWRDITQNQEPMPPVLEPETEDAAQFDKTDPWVEPPVYLDYGYQVHVAPGSFVNMNCRFIDTLPITIGSRVLIGPNCHFYSGSHPLDPAVRNGLKGPESGARIDIGDDCWLGGNVTVLPGVKIGKGAVCGACSVVTKDVPPFTVVAGNPAKILRKIETQMDPEQRGQEDASSKPMGDLDGDQAKGAEEPMSKMAE